MHPALPQVQTSRKGVEQEKEIGPRATRESRRCKRPSVRREHETGMVRARCLRWKRPTASWKRHVLPVLPRPHVPYPSGQTHKATPTEVVFLSAAAPTQRPGRNKEPSTREVPREPTGERHAWKLQHPRRHCWCERQAWIVQACTRAQLQRIHR